MGRSPTNNKEKLLHIAMDLIWQSSYGSVSVDEICIQADVNKGSFYYYFSTKADLAVEVMEQAYNSYEHELANVFIGSHSATEHFERLANFIYDVQFEAYQHYGRVCGCPFASLGSEMAGNNEAIRKKADEVFRRQDRILVGALQELVAEKKLSIHTDLVSMASEIHSFILGQLMMARIQNDLSNLKDDIKSGLLHIINYDQATLSRATQ